MTIPYTDDCDLGENAWISYDEGESGKAVGLLFSSNKNIVKYGKDERDGFKIKSGEYRWNGILLTDFTSIANYILAQITGAGHLSATGYGQAWTPRSR